LVSTNQFKNGMHVEVDGTVFRIVEFQHVKPGKGGAFVRTKLKNVRTGKVVDNVFRAGFRRLGHTFSDLGQFRDLATLLISVFFVMAGIYIIISFSFIYGAQVIGWEEHVRALMFVTVQITAAIGAIGFGYLQSRIGAKLTYMITLCLWLAAILAIWLTPQLTELARSLFNVDWEAQYVFLFAGCLAGFSLGSSQSAGRALVGVLTPRGKSAEFFGFWGTASKAAAVFGILGLGIIQAFFGLADAILFCLLLFVMALIAVVPVNERRGNQVAETWRDPQREH
jgi:MFS transporter, UMF1 family